MHDITLLTLWLYQWSLLQYLLCGAKTFISIEMTVITIKQCIYNNSTFIDIMYLMVKLLTPTLQNVYSVINTGLESSCTKYNKAPQQGIRLRQRTHTPNYTSGRHDRTHSKLSSANYNGAGDNWWSKHPWGTSTSNNHKPEPEQLSWCVPSTFIKFLCDSFQHQLISILHLS